MKTYGLKRINGIQNPDLLREIVKVEKGRLDRVRTEMKRLEKSGPELPAGTPNRARIHRRRLTKMNKRAKYKEKLIDKASARSARLVRQEQLRGEADKFKGRISSLAKLAAADPMLLNNVKEAYNNLLRKIKEDPEKAEKFLPVVLQRVVEAEGVWAGLGEESA